MEENPKELRQLEVEYSPNIQPLHSNFVSINMTFEEVILHFCERDMEDDSKASELARIYITPSHAKRLVVAMARSIKTYEENFGTIIINPLEHLTPLGRERVGIKVREANDAGTSDR